MACVFLISYNETLFSDGYSFDEYIYSDDIIHTYKVECEYTDTNKRYVEKNNIKLQNDVDKMIDSEKDIKQIIESKSVKEIIFFDEKGFYDTLNGKIDTVSIPYFFIYDYLNRIYAGEGLVGKIIEGRYPKDYRNEIALSKNGLSGLKNKYAVGDKISYLGKEYNIVGTIDADYNMTSYDGEDRNGFYSVASVKNHDIELCGLFIKTKKGQERKTLNWLISQYPAENYISKVFSKAWRESYNTDFIFNRVLPLNIAVSLLFAIISLISRWFQIKNDAGLYHDWKNYCLKPKSVKHNIMLVNSFSMLGEMVIIMGINAFISVAPIAMSIILFLDLLIISIPGIVMIGLKDELK